MLYSHARKNLFNFPTTQTYPRISPPAHLILVFSPTKTDANLPQMAAMAAPVSQVCRPSKKKNEIKPRKDLTNASCFDKLSIESEWGMFPVFNRHVGDTNDSE